MSYKKEWSNKIESIITDRDKEAAKETAKCYNTIMTKLMLSLVVNPKEAMFFDNYCDDYIEFSKGFIR